MTRNDRCVALAAAFGLLLSFPAVADVVGGSGIQDGNVYVTYKLANDFVELDVISTTDLINGFGVNSDDNCDGVTCITGLPINQGINESAIAPFALGWIDPYNGPMPGAPALDGVGSWLMESAGGCRQLFYTQPSDGFHPVGGNGNMAELVDGATGVFLHAILRDYSRASLVVRYGFENPTDIGRIRVFAGNLNVPGVNVGRDGRVFQYYDVYARQGNCVGPSGECPAGPTFVDGFDEFFPVALGVSTGQPGFLTNNPANNPNPWEGTQTDVISFDSDVLIPNCTDLRIVFYCVSNTQGFFIDPWQGYVNDDPTCEPMWPAEPEDTDGYQKAFEAPIIKEIDVFGPIDTPVGDIDYDGDHDLVDFAALQNCFNADVTTNGCYRYDIDTNGTIDAADYTLFAPLLTGP